MYGKWWWWHYAAQQIDISKATYFVCPGARERARCSISHLIKLFILFESASANANEPLPQWDELHASPVIVWASDDDFVVVSESFAYHQRTEPPQRTQMEMFKCSFYVRARHSNSKWNKMKRKRNNIKLLNNFIRYWRCAQRTAHTGTGRPGHGSLLASQSIGIPYKCGEWSLCELSSEMQVRKTSEWLNDAVADDDGDDARPPHFLRSQSDAIITMIFLSFLIQICFLCTKKLWDRYGCLPFMRCAVSVVHSVDACFHMVNDVFLLLLSQLILLTVLAVPAEHGTHRRANRFIRRRLCYLL